MITIPYPISGTNPALTHPECLCSVGLECSWDGHYTGRTNATFSLDQSSVQASQGPTRGAINHKLHETGHPSIHPLKYQNPQQIDFLAQDVCSGPPAELDAPPASFGHLGNQASEGDDQHVAFYPDDNNQVILQEIDTPPTGSYVLVPGTHDGGFGHDVQDHRSNLDTTKTLDSQGSPQSSQAPHYMDPRYQHRGYDGMQVGSMLAGSPGSECSASFNGFPSLGIRSWNNGIANMEQGAYGMRLHAEHNFVDMGITADPQNLQDVVPHWPNSTAVCHQPAGEWNPSPQVKPSGERPLPLHRGAGKKQIPDSVIQPYIFDVPLQRNSGTPSNAPPPHFLSPPIAFQSKSTRNIHTQQRNRHHVSVSTTKPAQPVGQNISIATDFVDYPADGRQIQCSSTFPVLRSTGSRSLAGCCGGDHQTSSCSVAIEPTNHSMVLGDQWQEKSGPPVPVALSNDTTMDQGMVNEPLSHHVTSTSIRNRDHLLRSSQASIGIKCLWRDEDVCGQWVTGETSAEHLASFHNIKDISCDRKIQCKACYPPKEIKRESILRHFIEVHIGIKRRPSSGKGKKNRNCSVVPAVPSTQPGAWMSTRTVGG